MNPMNPRFMSVFWLYRLRMRRLVGWSVLVCLSVIISYEGEKLHFLASIGALFIINMIVHSKIKIFSINLIFHIYCLPMKTYTAYCNL